GQLSLQLVAPTLRIGFAGDALIVRDRQRLDRGHAVVESFLALLRDVFDIHRSCARSHDSILPDRNRTRQVMRVLAGAPSERQGITLVRDAEPESRTERAITSGVQMCSNACLRLRDGSP